MEVDQKVRRLRHDLRGQINALVLSTSALAVAEDDQDRMAFLDSVDSAADKLLVALDALEALPDAFNTD